MTDIMTHNGVDNGAVFLPFITPLPDQGAGSHALSHLRDHAEQAFAALGLPTRQQEAWKYTSLAHLGETPLRLPPRLTLTRHDLEALDLVRVDGFRLVMVDGHFVPALSDMAPLPDGVRVSCLEDVMQDNPAWLEEIWSRTQAREAMNTVAFAALVGARSTTGLVLQLADGVKVDRPVHLVNLSTRLAQPTCAFGRVVLELGENASLDLVESACAIGEHAALFATLTDIVLAPQARLEQVRLVRDTPHATRVETTLATVDENATYSQTSVILGGQLTRNEVRVLLAGPGSCAHVNGAYGARKGEHVDHTIFVDHATPGGTSSQLFRGVLDETGHGVFQGQILVRKGAHATDGRQLHKALMLSEGGEIDIKPELFIYADDVSCAHGATAGEMDEEALFYLQSRGLTLEEARTLLVEAFLNDVLENIENTAIRSALAAPLESWRKSVVTLKAGA